MIRELLPNIAFCETDTASVEAALIADYEAITGRSLYPGNPERLFVEAVAYLISQQRFMIDYTGKMNLVSLADGPYLDHLGAFMNANRLGSGYAQTVLRFTASGVLAWDLVIPAGTRATADGSLFFATDAEAVITAGQTTVDAPATCQEAGTVGNGLLAGQINRLVDRMTYLAGVANTTLTLGGTDTESDARYRGRVRLAPERFSTCGPTDAYRYHALSVSQEIIDVAVWCPQEGQVKLAPLCRDGAMPSAALINAVASAVNAEKTRPLTDGVQVVTPETVAYSVAGTFYVKSSYASKAGQIQAQVQKALADYLAWQRTKIGRDITPSELVSRIQSIDGVQRVALSEPEYQALAPWKVATHTTAQLTYGGLND